MLKTIINVFPEPFMHAGDLEYTCFGASMQIMKDQHSM